MVTAKLICLLIILEYVQGLCHFKRSFPALGFWCTTGKLYGNVSRGLRDTQPYLHPPRSSVETRYLGPMLGFYLPEAGKDISTWGPSVMR